MFVFKDGEGENPHHNFFSANTNAPIIFGGSFDPIHLGHLNIIHQVLKVCSFSKVIIVPSWLSPFKYKSKYTPKERFTMCNLALLDYLDLYGEDEAKLIEISDFEIKKEMVSYTCDTLKYFSSFYKSGNISFLCGDDVLDDLNKWEESDWLKKNVVFYCIKRNKELFLEKGNKIKKDGWNVNLISINPIEASSSQIRNNQGLEYLSKRVREYVEKI